jgi:hypothetical protein
MGSWLDLDLGRAFDCVVLGSHLINQADTGRRRAFLAACRRHVDPDGCVLMERYEPDLDWRARVGTSVEFGEVTCTLRYVRLEGAEVDGVMEYRVGDRVWTHRFSAILLGDGEIDRELEAAGLEPERWLDDRRSWLKARVAG